MPDGKVLVAGGIGSDSFSTLGRFSSPCELASEGNQFRLLRTEATLENVASVKLF